MTREDMERYLRLNSSFFIELNCNEKVNLGFISAQNIYKVCNCKNNELIVLCWFESYDKNNISIYWIKFNEYNRYVTMSFQVVFDKFPLDLKKKTLYSLDLFV